MMRRLVLTALVTVATLCLTGCDNYRGINSLALPGDVGTGHDSYQVTVELPDAANLVPNTPVMINDITIGTVTKVALTGWTPTVTLSLVEGAHLPANAVARLGQTSILGSKHIELAAPREETPTGTLQAGAVIPLTRVHDFPQTEDLLSATSLLLNGGGLQSFQTITHELNTALAGREGTARDFLTQVNNLADGLDGQKADIITALRGLDRLGGTLGPRMDTIDAALNTLPEGLKTLHDDEPALRDALDRLGRANQSLRPFTHGGTDNLRGVFHEIEPVARRSADAEPGNIMQAVKLLATIDFPIDWLPHFVRADSALFNVATVDLTNEELDKEFLTGTPAAGALYQGTRLLKGKSIGDAPTSGRSPLLNPLRGSTTGTVNPLPELPPTHKTDPPDHRLLPGVPTPLGGDK
jgi:phospholipid/cholesterol/gamma-HCH transport system substrate-binding protein